MAEMTTVWTSWSAHHVVEGAYSRTAAAHEPEITHPILCASQWIPSVSQKWLWSILALLSDGQAVEFDMASREARVRKRPGVTSGRAGYGCENGQRDRGGGGAG